MCGFQNAPAVLIAYSRKQMSKFGTYISHHVSVSVTRTDGQKHGRHEMVLQISTGTAHLVLTNPEQPSYLLSVTARSGFGHHSFTECKWLRCIRLYIIIILVSMFVCTDVSAFLYRTHRGCGFLLSKIDYQFPPRTCTPLREPLRTCCTACFCIQKNTLMKSN